MTTTIRRDEHAEGRTDRPTTAAPAPPATRSRRPGDTGLTGAVLGVAVVALALAAAFGGAASAVQLGFPALAVAGALVLLLQGRWYSYLSFTVLVWLTAATIRRIVDWQTVYHSVSPITIAGSLVSLAALPWVIGARRPAYRDARAALSLGALVCAFGLLVGLVRNGTTPALADFLLLGPPLVTGLFVLTVPDDDDRLQRVVQGIALWGTLAVGGYALVQFLVLPDWDARWITDSGITTVGRPEAGTFRAFGSLGTSGPLAYVMTVLLLLLVAERRTWRQLPVAVVGLAALAVTQIRGGWISFALGVVLLVARGRTQALRMVALVAVALVAVLSAGGPIADQITERASETAAEGTEDTSLVLRLEFQAEIAPQALSDPIGAGMGATGVASDLGSSDPAYSRYRNFDSGLFETLTRYGVVGGLAVLGSVVWTVAASVRRSRSTTLFRSACAAATVALAVGLLLTDTLRSAYGLLFWLLIALQGRPSRAARDAAAPAPAR